MTEWIAAFFRLLGLADWTRTEIVLLLMFVLVLGAMRYLDKRHQASCAETRSEMEGRHKICEWRIMKITGAMMTHIRANNSGRRSNQGRRDTDKLVGDLLEAALRGPQTPADLAEVESMEI